LKVYANNKLQGTTPRSKDSIKLREGRSDSKPTKATREASTLQDLNLRAENLLTLKESFSGILGSLTPLTLKMSRRGFDMILSATSTLQPSTLATEDDLHLWQKKVFDATQSITGGLEEQPLWPNSNLVSAPLTTTLRNLGTRFCLREEEL
jgi:hypothetical protein